MLVRSNTKKGVEIMNANGESPDKERVRQQLLKAFDYLFEHDGSSHMDIDMRILKRGQKEILIKCGRCYRYVVDCGE